MVYMEQHNDSECLTSSYITTSAPDEKSPFAANVMVHLQQQPLHTNVIDHQQHQVITSQHNLEQDKDHQEDEEDDDEEENPDEDGQPDCDNVEYLSSNMHHDTGLIQLENVVHHTQSARNNTQHRSIVVSTSGGISADHMSSTGNRIRLAPKRQLEIPRVDDDDEDDENYEEDDPLESQLGGPTFFAAQASKFPSINRSIDNHKEIIMLRKKLMIREFEMVQQKHQLEIEILQRDLEFKKTQHQKIIECLNKKLSQK